jgi:hypothetical protein
LEKTTEEDLNNSNPSEISEELIDQNLFEAQYVKKPEDNDEFKSIN